MTMSLGEMPWMTRVRFVGGTEDGRVREVWATREIVVVVQSTPLLEHTVKRLKLRALMSKTAPKPRRQIYALAYRGPSDMATYTIDRVEDTV